ncbi:MAG: tRNA 2-thiouridine synthesizing protein A [Arenicella sp.]|jgi:tRNA 2-thiouridine synthesizing protein A
MTDKPLTQAFETEPTVDIQVDIQVDMSIDTCGTRCPIPLLRAKQALKTLAVGEHLQVLASDPSAKPDFDAMLRHLPHRLVSYTTQVSPSRIDTFIIQKGE